MADDVQSHFASVVAVVASADSFGGLPEDSAAIAVVWALFAVPAEVQGADGSVVVAPDDFVAVDVEAVAAAAEYLWDPCVLWPSEDFAAAMVVGYSADVV